MTLCNMTITKNILHPPLFGFHNTNSTYSVHLICTSTCVSCKQLPVLFLSRVCWQYFSILRTFPGVVWQVHHTAICIKAGSQSKAFHNKDEMAEKTAILLWLIVYVMSTFVLVTVEAVYKLYSISKLHYFFIIFFLLIFNRYLSTKHFCSCCEFCVTMPLCFCFVLLIIFRTFFIYKTYSKENAYRFSFNDIFYFFSLKYD